MTTMKFIKLFLIPFLFFGFKPNETAVINNNELIGTWVYSTYKDDLLYYKKKNNLKKDNAGIEFFKSGKLIKRQNESGCGTPPITYKNFNGSWEKKTDSTISLTYQNWGGMYQEEWQISSLTKDKMVVKRTSFQMLEKKSVERDRFR